MLDARAGRRRRRRARGPRLPRRDKPAGLVVHPGAGHRTARLIAGLLARYPELGDARHARGCRPAPPRDRPAARQGHVGRCLVVARTPEAYASLSSQLQARTVERRYVGLVEGDVTDDARRDRRADRPLPAHADEDGGARRAAGPPAPPTRCSEHFTAPPRTLLELRLESGRTHQIRVHLAAIGRPIVNDPRYGQHREPRLAEGRVFLHARGARLRAPGDRSARPRHLAAARRPRGAARHAQRLTAGPSTASIVVNASTSPRRSLVGARRPAARGRGRPATATRRRRRRAARGPRPAAARHRRQHPAEPDVVRGEQDRPREGVHRGPADERVAVLVAVDRRERAQVREHDAAGRAPRPAARRTRGSPRPCGRERPGPLERRGLGGAVGDRCEGHEAGPCDREVLVPARRVEVAQRAPTSRRPPRGPRASPGGFPPLGAKRAVSRGRRRRAVHGCPVELPHRAGRPQRLAQLHARSPYGAARRRLALRPARAPR